MLPPSDETRFFEAHKAELLRTHPGRFALICGRRLIGVYDSVEQALGATAEAFDRCNIPPGAPILISEIAETVSLRVVALPNRNASRASASA